MQTYGLLQYKAMGRVFIRSFLRENPFPVVTYKLSWEVSQPSRARHIVRLVPSDQRRITLIASDNRTIPLIAREQE